MKLATRTLTSRLWLLFLLCWLLPAAAYADTAATDVDRDGLPLSQLFPKATRSGEKQLGLPVYPLYQLNQLLGYAWRSPDINDLPGFAGKPISLLIGLDIKGKFENVVVLDHHEPVFLHGLGEQPLWDFVAQYAGRSVTEQIIVATPQNKKRQTIAGGPIFFDGVTKATISVMIINDVVLSSALQVARKKLDGFALPSQTVLTEKPFVARDWDDLVNRQLIHRWYISNDEAVTKLERLLDDYQDTLDFTEHEETFSELFFGYLNDEEIGRNLLGEAAYEALISQADADDHFMWIGSNGGYRHIGNDFTPGTAPARFALQQNGLAIELKDTNQLPLDIIAAAAPAFESMHIFRIKGLTGYSPGNETTLRFNVELPRNHLITDHLELTDTYQLPESEWHTETVIDESLTRTPLWVTLWKDRIMQIVILLCGLSLLLYVFARQKHFSQYAKGFRRFRAGFLVFTVFFIGFYAQGQLSIVNVFTLLHSIRDGFDIGIFLLDPVIFILWCVTFVSLFVVGRGLFCGWLCPFGALQEMSSWLGKALKIKQYRVPEQWHRRLIYIKYPLLALLIALSFWSLTWAERLAEIEPFKTSITLVFIRTWPFVLYAVALLAASLFIHKFYCRYLCTLGAGLAFIGGLRRFEWLERIPFCGSPCQTCHSKCEIKAIKRDGSIDYNECVQCMECIVILNNDSLCVDKLMAKKRKTIVIKAMPVT